MKFLKYKDINNYSPEEVSFNKTFDLYFNKVLAYVNSYCHDIDNSKNITQDVFIAYWENIHKVDSTKTALPYLLRIAKNRTLNYLQRNKLHKAYTNSTSIADLEFTIHSLRNSTIEKIYENNIERIFMDTLDEMSDSIRETYLLRLHKGLTNNEISEKMNISVRTVEYRIKKALQLLRLGLKDYIVAPMLFFFGQSMW